MYKTSNPDHRPSMGVLADLIRKFGATSAEVQAYLARYESDSLFLKRAAPLLDVGSRIDAIRKSEMPDSADKKA